MKRTLAIAIAALAVVLVSGKLVKAFNPQPDPPGGFGLVNITPGDTMQLNVVNIDVDGAPPDPCKVTLRFLNSSGVTIKQQTVSVKSKASASLTLTGAEAGGAFRNPVHAVLLQPSNQPTGCSAMGSVEIFNSTTGEDSIVMHPVFVSLPAK